MRGSCCAPHAGRCMRGSVLGAVVHPRIHHSVCAGRILSIFAWLGLLDGIFIVIFIYLRPTKPNSV